MKAATAGLLVLLLVVGCDAKKPVPPPASTNSASSSGSPLTAPVDYLGAVGKAQKKAANTTDLLTVQQAIRAFEAGEERAPASLNELVTEGYLPRLPAAPKGLAWSYDPGRRAAAFVPAPPGR
ncbi:MAG: hypothetical protein ACKVYV_03960 [Limisphaerales bacterium]